MGAVFTDENQSWEFDFSKAIWATDQLHENYKTIKDSILHDVDFIIEDTNQLLFVECKNANFKGVTCPKSFKPLQRDSIHLVARKYYDSIHFVKGLGKGKTKKFIYVYVVEAHNGSATERKGIRNRLRDRLPFKLQKNCKFEDAMIHDVYVLSIDEWNKKYPQYPAARLKERMWEI